MPGMLTAVSDFTQDVLESDVPVLVDFWAQWCPPCHMIAPILEEIARERAGSLSIYKVNADDNPGIGQTYGVLALPTLILFRGGQPVMSVVGARPKSKLLAEIDAALN
jgi:thioredoxin 1